MELVPVEDWEKPQDQWVLDYDNLWEVLCSCIYYYDKSSLPVQVAAQIDIGEENLAKKALQTTWSVNAILPNFFLTVSDRNDISWAVSAKDDNTAAIKRALSHPRQVEGKCTHRGLHEVQL